MIDYVSHRNDSEGILAEMRDFDRAVRVAMEYVDAHPGTLLVVTADHETGGLTLPSGNADFTKSESGVLYKYGRHGSRLSLRYGRRAHQRRDGELRSGEPADGDTRTGIGAKRPEIEESARRTGALFHSDCSRATSSSAWVHET